MFAYLLWLVLLTFAATRPAFAAYGLPTPELDGTTMSMLAVGFSGCYVAYRLFKMTRK